MSKTIFPPQYLKSIDAPLIFLAGPIQGAYDWQSKAIELIAAKAPKLYIASPRRNLRAEYSKGDFTGEIYAEQVDWETFHLRKAGKNGAILFWLAKEFEHHCDRAYAQTTRFELAEWKLRHERDKSKLVIGIEDGFTNAKYIMRRFLQDCPDIIIRQTLEETCDDAVRLAEKT